MDRARGLHDSAAKLDQIQGLCREYDVRTRPFLLHGTAWVVPLLSWHHASWDREPGMGGKRHAWAFSDYSACVWPDSIPGAGSVGGPGLARWFDAKNEGEGWAAALAGVREHDVISMSHFLPREVRRGGASMEVEWRARSAGQGNLLVLRSKGRPP